MRDKTDAQKQDNASINKSDKDIQRKPEHSADGSSLLGEYFRTMQCEGGNQAVQRLVKSGVIQAKLQVSSPGDAHEREADRVAAAVMSMPESRIQPKPAADGDLVMGKEEPGQALEVSSAAEQSVKTVQRSGNSLPDDTRSFFETRFKHDFSTVRIHNDAKAHRAARDINARAFTIGNDIAFGKGEYQPASREGKSLLAHELTHVVQQGGGVSRKVPTPTPTPADKKQEEDVVLLDGPDYTQPVQDNTQTMDEPLYPPKEDPNADQPSLLQTWRNWLDEHWPIGSGFNITGELGGAGYSVYVSAEGKIEITRVDQYDMELFDAQRVTLAAMAVVGAEATFNMGPVKVEAVAKAEAQGGIKLQVTETYHYPIESDEAFRAFLFRAIPWDIMSMGAVFGAFMKMRAREDSRKYLKETDTAVLGFVAGAGNAGAGVVTEKKKGKTSVKDKVKNTLISKILPEAFARAGLKGEAGEGSRMEFTDKGIVVTSYKTASGTVMAGLGINVFKPLVQLNFFNINEEYTYERTELFPYDGSEPKNMTITLKKATGSPDALEPVIGPGSEVSLEFNLDKGLRFDTPLNALISIPQLLHQLIPTGMGVELRMGLGKVFGKKFRKYMTNDYLTTTHKNKGKVETGLITEGIVTVNLQFNKDEIVKIIEGIVQVFQKITNDEIKLTKLVWEIFTEFIMKGNLPPELQKADILLEVFKEVDIVDAIVRGSVGFGVGASARVGEGVTFDLHGNVAANVFYERDLLTMGFADQFRKLLTSNMKVLLFFLNNDVTDGDLVLTKEEQAVKEQYTERLKKR